MFAPNVVLGSGFCATSRVVPEAKGGHPGFKAVQKKIAGQKGFKPKKPGQTKAQAASAILGATAQKAKKPSVKQKRVLKAQKSGGVPFKKK